jgi:hypothetical protein
MGNTWYGTASSVIKTEGALGLYRGVAPTLIGAFPYEGIKVCAAARASWELHGDTRREQRLSLPRVRPRPLLQPPLSLTAAAPPRAAPQFLAYDKFKRMLPHRDGVRPVPRAPKKRNVS